MVSATQPLLIFLLFTAVVAICPNQCKKSKAAVKECHLHPSCTTVKCQLPTGRKGKKCTSQLSSPPTSPPGECPQSCTSFKLARKACKRLLKNCVVTACDSEHLFKCGKKQDSPTPRPTPTACSSCPFKEFVGSGCKCVNRPCDACPDGTVCRKAGTTRVGTATPPGKLNPGDFFCVSCECGFCDAQGRACCETKSANCLKSANSLTGQCEYRDFGIKVDNSDAQDVCTPNGEVELGTARKMVSTCGCIPNQDTPCVVPSDSDRSNCVVSRGDDLEPGEGLLLFSDMVGKTRVIACDDSNVFIQTTESLSLDAGNYILSLPTQESSGCTGCNTLARRITAVRADTNFGTSECAQGASCYLLSTVEALVPEVIDVSFFNSFPNLPPLNPAETASTPLIDLLCPTNGDTVRRGDLSQVEHLMYGGPDGIKATIRQSRPTVCSDYRSANADGRCSYTNCFVGDNGSGNDCFFCKSSCSNGCSYVPDSIIGIFDFSAPCCSHDYCYSSTFLKEQCDRFFYGDMLRSCVDSPLDVLQFIPIPITRLATILRCPAMASLYYLGVVLGGGGAYNGAQRDQMAYEETPNCVAMCPTTQRSGGQGTTTVRVDLMQTEGTFQLSYNHFSIPDEVTVNYEGQTIFSTGGLVSGSRTVPISYSGSSSVVTVTMNAPRSGTAWTLSVACPPTPPSQ